MKTWNEIKDDIKEAIFTIEDKDMLFKSIKEIYLPTPKKINGETIYFENGGELRQTFYKDYGEGDGLVIVGGGYFDKNGIYVGHVDPCGPKGIEGTQGSGVPVKNK